MDDTGTEPPSNFESGDSAFVSVCRSASLKFPPGSLFQSDCKPILKDAQGRCVCKGGERGDTKPPLAWTAGTRTMELVRED